MGTAANSQLARIINFSSCRWGSSLPVCAGWTYHCPPNDMSGNLLAQLSAKSRSNISPQPLRTCTQSFGTPGQLLKIPHFVPNITQCGGKGRSPKFVFGWKTNIFVTPCTFPEPFLPSSRKKSKEEEERKRKRNNTLKIGHYVLPGTPKGSALTLLRPTFPDFAFICFVTSSVLRYLRSQDMHIGHF